MICKSIVYYRLSLVITCDNNDKPRLTTKTITITAVFVIHDNMIVTIIMIVITIVCTSTIIITIIIHDNLMVAIK